MAFASNSAGDLPVWRRPRAERYLKLEHLASGSFGKVSFAIDLLTNRRVAIKKQDANSESTQREFALLSALTSHPSAHVTGMLDYFTTKEKNKMVLQTVHHLADSTLWKVYKFSRGGLPDSRVAKYMFGVVAGLSHLNSIGIVHADASLSNMLLTREDCVQVADFGTAFSAMQAMSDDKGEITTVYVRSPERLLGEPVVRPSVDVWAFGVQFFCLRSGRCPWLELPLSRQYDDDEKMHSAVLRQLTTVLGCVPLQSPLRSLPKWETLSIQGATDDVQPSDLWSRWSAEAQSTCRLALRWDPSDRAAWDVLLAAEFFASERTPQLAMDMAMNSSRSSSSLLAPGASQEKGSESQLKPRSPSPCADADGLATMTTASSRAAQQGDEFERRSTASSRAAQPCQCNGNCGSRLHKARANQRYRNGDADAICLGTVLPHRKLCQRCTCERAGCGLMRRKNKRWCTLHACELKPNQYAVPSGVHSLGKSWPPVVRTLARLAHILPFCFPTDASVLVDFIDEFDMLKLGEPFQPKHFAWLFMAHLAKWPPAVLQWSRILRRCNPSTAVEIVEQFRELIRWCHRADWGDMFDRMSGMRSLMDAQTGLAIHADRMKLIASRKEKTSSEKPESKRQRETVIALGRRQNEYHELSDAQPAIEIIDNILSSAESLALQWPASDVDVPAFANSLLELIKVCRRFKSPTGDACLKGGININQSYNAKHFLRIVLLRLESSLPEAFQPLLLNEIHEWCPDENHHASVFDRNTRGQDVQHKFGCSPLLWSCWACLIGFATPDMIAAGAKADLKAMWDRFLTLEHSMRDVTEGGFVPGPQVLLEAYQ